MQNNQLTIRKIIALLGLAIVLLILISWLINYLTTGRIVITSGNKYADVNISSIQKNTTGKGFSKHAKSSLSTRLKAGGYFVTVGNGTNGTTRYVKVKARSTTRINVSLLDTTGVEPVLYDSVQNIVADSSRLEYLSSDDSAIGQINTQNEESESGEEYGLRSIQWANTNYGVGQNSKGQLFVINSGQVSALHSPVSGKEDGSVVYSVAPNKKIYIGSGSSVYAGSQHGGFKKIYSNRPSGSFLLAGSGRVAVLSSGYHNTGSTVTVINNDGSQLSKNFDKPFNAWSSWSQNDKYLLITVGPLTEILDASLQVVATVPQSGNIAYPAWLDDDTVFYSVGGQLWSFEVGGQKARLVANMPLNNSIKEIDVSTDKAYVYLVTFDNKNFSTVRRVGLRGQKVSELVYRLQDIMPAQFGGYTIRLINFSEPPVIQVVLYGGSDPVGSLQSAKQELQSRGFDIGSLNITEERVD